MVGNRHSYREKEYNILALPEVPIIPIEVPIKPGYRLDPLGPYLDDTPPPRFEPYIITEETAQSEVNIITMVKAKAVWP
jgi:hypothetical protein